MPDCLKSLFKFIAYIYQKIPSFVIYAIVIIVALKAFSIFFVKDENLVIYICTIIMCITACVTADRDYKEQQKVRKEIHEATKAIEDLRKAIIEYGKTNTNKK